MALIELSGKYAVGQNRYAVVDDDMYAALSAWKWKAKPNGSRSNIYAVRNIFRNGKNITLRMHRVVMGLRDDIASDVDHINHNPLDNRRENLRAVSRSVNIANARRIARECQCKHCGRKLKRTISLVQKNAAMSCEECTAERERYAPRSTVSFPTCECCGVRFTARLASRRFCSDRCRCTARRKARGSSAGV